MEERVRLGIELVQETTSVVFVEDAREAPGMILERLNVLDLDKEHITRLGSFNLEWTRQVVNLGQVDVLDIVGTVVVLDLPSCPIETLDLHGFSILDGSAEWHLIRCFSNRPFVEAIMSQYRQDAICSVECSAEIDCLT